MLNSVARLPLWLAAGTPVLNMRFQAGLLRTDQGRAATGALIRAFFARGGMQAQVAVVDRNDMLAAQRDPEAHRDLLVRIGGYSEYFVRLDRELQDSVMARTEHAT
jgi:formate C-acetyltransferase